MDFSALSERFAYSTKLGADKRPLVQCFGIIVSGGVCRPGLLYCARQVRNKTLTLELYEPGEKGQPVRLGSVTVKLRNQLRPCGDGAMHTGLEWEVLSKEYAD